MLALGERHWSVTEHRFIDKLIRDSQFPSVFRVIVVEFGNALYQPTLDRYLAGENVSREDLNKVWKNTTVPMAWDSPLYADFFDHVREVNKGLGKDKKIRVILGDPPVDWASVNSVADFKPFMDRDKFYAEVMAKNCASERCMLISGTNHFYRKDPLANLRPPSVHKNALEYYAADAGNTKTMESVLPLFSQAAPFTSNAATAPALMSTHAPPLAIMRFGQVDPSPVTILKKVDGETKAIEVRADDTLPASDVFDWVLFLGSVETKTETMRSLYEDKAYVRELYRRAKIVGDAFGFDLTEGVREIDPNAKH